MEHPKEWFASWFNTTYYHILYKHRDYREAQLFMHHLISYLNLKKGDSVLDLACGKGRHAIYLNSLGFNVTGADLSKNSIAYAKQFENTSLKFVEHDMRNPFQTKFNAIFNLFTSFGFFEDDAEDIAILQNIKNGLLPNGVAVIDFLNVKKAVNELIPEETITIDTIEFHIKRYVEKGFIIKEINFFADGKQHRYFEKVKSLHLNKIKLFLETVGFEVQHIFGNYKLDQFDEENSDRLILILK